MLFGIKDSSGFSSNADELAEAERQTIERVVMPKQNAITDALEDILSTDDITLNLYFKPLSERKEKVELKAQKQICCSEDEKTPTEEITSLLISLGEDESEKWELLCSSEVEYDTDSDLHGYLNLATSTGVARPNAKSEQDSQDIKIRYRYVGNPNPQRDFCKKMMSANKLYRKEDIIAMEKQTVNPGFGYVAGGEKR